MGSARAFSLGWDWSRIGGAGIAGGYLPGSGGGDDGEDAPGPARGQVALDARGDGLDARCQFRLKMLAGMA